MGGEPDLGARGSAADSLARLGVPVTRARGLIELAEQTQHAAGPLLVVADDLYLSPAALLDVVDAPSSATAAVTLDASQAGTERAPLGLAPVRVSRGRRVESSGTRLHTVGRPTDHAVGLLRVADSDRDEAARLWRAAATHDLPSSPAGVAVAPVDLALLALVRGGLPVAATGLGLYTVGRAGRTLEGAPGSPWQQRLRSSSRGNDGAFSRAVVRPLSRKVTALGLAHDWRPNTVTAVSLALGLAAAALVLLDSWWAWAAAALVLQASLVVDCVDGEIARFTRSYSPLGAWLDGVSDRVKEFAVIAAVTFVGVRHGHDLWGLSVVLLAVLTVRQVEDQAYNARLRAAAGQPDTVRPLDEPADGSGSTAPTTVAPPPSRRARLVKTVKQVLHVPIAERYLLISLGLLTHNAVVLLVVLLGAVLVALAWTHLGRTAVALRGADTFRADRPDRADPDPDLGMLFDLGPLSRLAPALAPGRVGAAAAWVAVLLVIGGYAFMAAGTSALFASVCVVAAALLLGAGCGGAARPAATRLGWQLPGWVAAAEAVTALGVVASLDAAHRWVAFAWFGAVAWHLYDMTYRVRETGTGPAGWVAVATLGSDGRMLLLGLWWAIGLPMAPLLAIGALAFFAVWAGESGYSWRFLAPARSRSGGADSERTRR